MPSYATFGLWTFQNLVLDLDNANRDQYRPIELTIQLLGSSQYGSDRCTRSALGHFYDSRTQLNALWRCGHVELARNTQTRDTLALNWFRFYDTPTVIIGSGAIWKKATSSTFSTFSTLSPPLELGAGLLHRDSLCLDRFMAAESRVVMILIVWVSYTTIANFECLLIGTQLPLDNPKGISAKSQTLQSKIVNFGFHFFKQLKLKGK